MTPPLTPPRPLPPHPIEAIRNAAQALEDSRCRLVATLDTAPSPRAGGSDGRRWRALLHTLAAHRPWLLLGAAALMGSLLGLLGGAGPRRSLRRGLVLLVGPALWGALRAEGQRLVQQLIRSRLFAGVAGGSPRGSS